MLAAQRLLSGLHAATDETSHSCSSSGPAATANNSSLCDHGPCMTVDIRVQICGQRALPSCSSCSSLLSNQKAQIYSLKKGSSAYLVLNLQFFSSFYGLLRAISQPGLLF